MSLRAFGAETGLSHTIRLGCTSAAVVARQGVPLPHLHRDSPQLCAADSARPATSAPRLGCRDRSDPAGAGQCRTWQRTRAAQLRTRRLGARRPDQCKLTERHRLGASKTRLELGCSQTGHSFPGVTAGRPRPDRVRDGAAAVGVFLPVPFRVRVGAPRSIKPQCPGAAIVLSSLAGARTLRPLALTGHTAALPSRSRPAGAGTGGRTRRGARGVLLRRARARATRSACSCCCAAA